LLKENHFPDRSLIGTLEHALTRLVSERHTAGAVRNAASLSESNLCRVHSSQTDWLAEV
jgi:hypothetical protein